MSDRSKQGTRTTNRDYVRYDQVRKTQTYHLAESAEGEGFDEEFRIRS